MKYTAQYFRDNFPEWKRRKDPLPTRFFRSISFYVSAFCANRGIQANTVSVFSSFVAVVACLLFLPGNYWCNIAGAVLSLVWLLLDCVDGNLARSVKPQPFGEFVDGESSYILIAFLGSCAGISAYFTEGSGVILHSGNAWVIFVGAVASSCDTLARLVYQKYQNVASGLSAKGIIPPQREKRTEHEHSASLRVRLEQYPGPGGILLYVLFACAVFNVLDIAVIYMALYYCAGGIFMIGMYTARAMRFRNLPMESQM